MMHKLVFHNDRVSPIEQVRLSPGQAGLFNGWGVFTTLRIYEGKPFAFELHWARLMRDAGRIQLPLGRSAEQVRAAVQQLVEANRVGSGCVRVYFVYNKIGLWASDERMPAVDLVLTSGDLPQRVGPTRLAVTAQGRHAAHPLAGTKVISWLNNVWMVEQAHQRGFDDAILLNERNEVSECTAANIFCVAGGKLRTPPLDSGCLQGVSRDITLELAQQLGIRTEERPLALEEMLTADEVFITSTTRQVQPVSHIEERKIRQAPGPVTERLAAAFTDYVRGYLARSAAMPVTAAAQR